MEGTNMKSYHEQDMSVAVSDTAEVKFKQAVEADSAKLALRDHILLLTSSLFEMPAGKDSSLTKHRDECWLKQRNRLHC